MSDEASESLVSEELFEYLIPKNFQANFTLVSLQFSPKEITIFLRSVKIVII